MAPSCSIFCTARKVAVVLLRAKRMATLAVLNKPAAPATSTETEARATRTSNNVKPANEEAAESDTLQNGATPGPPENRPGMPQVRGLWQKLQFGIDRTLRELQGLSPSDRPPAVLG